MAIETISQQKCFDGVQGVFSHSSNVLGCVMRFAVYLPPLSYPMKTPVLFWLSGLTCTEENFITKAHAQESAAKLGMAIVVCDTSPRHLNIPGEADSYAFGVGAGFYLDATTVPWSKNYLMYRYITQELFELIGQHFEVDLSRAGIFGHSMGGHGALTIALKNPHQFKSVSAFAPIAAPMQSPWGMNAFQKYLGDDCEAWCAYDTTELLRSHGWQGPPILVDQGTADPYIDTQLKPHLLVAACEKNQVDLTLRFQKGYDHSYFFIASFIEDHVRFHQRLLIQT